MPDFNIAIKPLGALVQALSRFGQQLYQAPKDDIRGITIDAWQSPLQPVRPLGPEGTEPRAFQYWAGQNLLWTPRSDAEYTAADLKQLATYPLARICIENVKDEVGRVPMEIQLRPQPGENKKQTQARASGNKDLVKLNRFFERPDREHDWPEWLGPLMDDMLVIDAATILIRKTFNGEIAELPVLRGDSITRYIDVNGFTPMPPDPAYAQIWWGVPLVNLSTDQLLYKPRRIVPRNTIASQLYGMSPTEQISEELKVGIKRLEFTLNYYTEGSIPGVIHVVPRGTPTNQIAEAMQWMNSELAGNLAARQQWRMIQGFNEEGKPDQIVMTKEQLLSSPFDELHIRKVCFAYGTSPQRLMKMIRTEGKSSNEAATIQGLLPWLVWLKRSIVDTLIQRYMGFPDFHAVFDPFEEADPSKEAERVTLLVSKGVMTPNQGREEIGEEPEDTPMANELGVITGTGFVPLDPEQRASQLATTGESKAGGGSDDHGGKRNRDNAAAAGDDQPGAGAKPNGKGDDRPASKPNGKSRKPNGKADGYIFAPATVSKAAKRKVIRASRHTAQTIAARRSTEKVLRNRLHRMQAKVESELAKVVKSVSSVASSVRKAEEDDITRRLLKAFGLEWAKMPDELEAPLVQAALSGAAEGVLQIELDDSDMIETVNQVASDWAARRAAEMVGMRRDKRTGKLYPNPDAKWAISDTTRDDLRKLISDVFKEEHPTADDIRERIEDAGIFSDTRASMIARTEIGRAQGQGNLAAWKESGLVQSVAWVTAGGHDQGDECDEYEADGPYAVEDVPDYPAHPNCTCTLIASEVGGDE